MSNSHTDNLPASERKAKNASETAREMAPFALYAAIPIIITICIALALGSR
jgi:hypothetical protein